MYIGGKFPFIHKEKPAEQQRSGPPTINWPSASLDVYFSESGYKTEAAGVDITHNTVLKHAAYWRAINLLSSQIASFPRDLYQRLPNGDTKELRNHVSYKLINQPNSVSTSFIFFESMQSCVLTYGNAYAYIKRKGNGDPVELMILDPAQVKPRLIKDELIYEVGEGGIVDPFFMLHIPGLSYDGVKGKSPVEVAGESIATGLAMQKFINNFYKNGAKQSGVLTHPHTLSPQARDNLRKDFEKKMKSKEGGTLILDEGMKYQGLSIPPDQAQLLESRRFSVEDIARWFGVPPHLLFEESRSTFNNIAEQGISFVRYTLIQWVSRWEAELNRKLLNGGEQEDHYFKFNVNALMRGNAKDRFEAYRAGLDLGIFSINEVRQLEEMNRIDGGDVHLVQLNRVPLNKISDGQNN